MDTFNINRSSSAIALLVKTLLFLSLCLFYFTGVARGDSVQYFYDDLSRFTRVVKGTSGIVYTYDSLGNPVSALTVTTTNSSPVISSINPNILFIGSKLLIKISGQNLLTTDSVIAAGSLVDIDLLTVTDTQITAEMTALSSGTETIRVATRNGTPNTATATVALSTSTVTLNPGQIAIVPGAIAAMTVTIAPPLSDPVTVNLNSSNPTVASVPQSISIPASGSVSFSINALQSGVTTINAGNSRSVVFVSNPFTGDVAGLTSGKVSVSIDAPSGTSPSTALPVSVSIDAPPGTSPSTALPVSVSIDAPPGTSPSVANPVSVKIQ